MSQRVGLEACSVAEHANEQILGCYLLVAVIAFAHASNGGLTLREDTSSR